MEAETKESRLNIRIEPSLKDSVYAAAKAESRTVASFVIHALKQYLEQNTKRSASSATTLELDFAHMDDLHSVLGKRRPAIADTLIYLEDK
jgi:uncharacterized protein (DUF1778 family)